MSRYFLKLAYNGAAYFGWQIQPEQISVQEVLEKALSLLLKEKISLTGCGRTDTGVHAREFYAHFDYAQLLSPEELTRLRFKLNSFLPKDIVIYAICKLHDDAHARFDAISRTYCYYLTLTKDPFSYPFTYRIFGKPDVGKMNAAAALLVSTDDFTSFSKLHTQVSNNICKVSEAFWREEPQHLIFTISADRFLRNMVRAIVGTLLEVGLNKLSVEAFQTVIESKDRGKAGISAPAHALFLERVRYSYLK